MYIEDDKICTNSELCKHSTVSLGGEAVKWRKDNLFHNGAGTIVYPSAKKQQQKNATGITTRRPKQL